MKIGFMLPAFGAMATNENMLTMAQLAEERGFESIWAPDHVIMPTKINYPISVQQIGPLYCRPQGRAPGAVYGAVVCGGLHPPGAVGVYRDCSAVPPSGGDRQDAGLVGCAVKWAGLIVGVGSGWLEEEFQALEVPFAKRWTRTDEHIQIWKELWTAEEPRFEGEYHRFTDVQCRPQPLQKPHPPITIGGRGRAGLRRVVSMADGWQVVSEHPDDVYSTEGDLAKDLQTLRQMCDEAGRDFSTIEITAVIIAGTAEGVLKDLPGWERLGVSRLILDFPSFASEPDEMAAILEKIAGEARDGSDLKEARMGTRVRPSAARACLKKKPSASWSIAMFGLWTVGNFKT